MTQIVQQGSVNIAGLVIPDAIVQIVPPQNTIITGAPSNILGIVGVASWGPTNTAMVLGGNNDALATFGPVTNRANDLATAVAVAVQQGANAFRGVRVSDGSDTAAGAVITASGTALTLTAKYTGTLGNLVQFIIGAGAGQSTTKVVVAMPNVAPEVYDNLSGGIFANTVVPGTGATAVPVLTFSAPTLANGRQARGGVNLVTVGTPTIGAGGSGYAVGDTITLANGVVVKVATVSAGAILTFQAQGSAGTNGGSITAGSVPTNPVAQVSTSGSGTGATVSLAWGLGTVTMTDNGTGYVAGATCAVGATGGSGTVTPIVTTWGNIALAINNGLSGIRGPSNILVATAGAGTGAPVNGTTTLAGGTDGAVNVTSALLIGQDVVPRKGIYALRNQGCAVVNVADLSDTTQYSVLAAFGLSEGCFMATQTALGDTISNAQTELATAGLDSYAVKVFFGDWVYWNDQVNGVLRLLGPATFWAGLRVNLSPQNSALNKQLFGVVGTQKSVTGSTYSSGELQSLGLARLDVIMNPNPAGTFFGCRFGRNSSSNVATRGENYTMMTNFLAASIAGTVGKIVGQLQNVTQRRQAKAMFDDFFNGLTQLGFLGGFDAAGNPLAQPWQTILNASNNPTSLVVQGYEQVALKVVYLSVIEYLIVNLEGGQTVQIQKVTVPQQQSLAA